MRSITSATFALALALLTAPACAQQSNADRAGSAATTAPRARTGGSVGGSSGGGGFGSSGSSAWSGGGGGGSGNSFLTLDQKLEKGSYLGISVTSAPGVLRDQLKLPRGVGLVVSYVEKGSPAETAGVKQSDVLMKLDDQLLINAQQFAVLVRTREANKEVRLSIIREAKPMEVAATPQERDIPALEDSALPLMLRSSRWKVQPDSGGAFNLESSDSQNQFSVTQIDGKRHLTARDKSGKIIFDGPIDTDDQLQKVPPEIRSKVQNLPGPGAFPTTRPDFRIPMKVLTQPPPA